MSRALHSLVSAPALVAGFVSCVPLLITGSATAQDRSPMPLFSFGVLADVQYADQATSGRRHYRSSLKSLEACVADLNAKDLKFVVQLGDLIDKDPKSFDEVLPRFRRFRARQFHVIGNHDLPMPRTAVLKRFEHGRGYYDFTVGDRWRFVAVDGMDVSLWGYPKGHPKRKAATTMLRTLKTQKAKNARPWNGGVGQEQLAWLQALLLDATKRKQQVMLFCHFPIAKEASTASHLLWNHTEVRRLLEKHACVVAWFNGHDHAGGYARLQGVHHVTLSGMVEAPKKNAYAVVHVYESRLVLTGVGKQKSLTLPLDRAQGSK